MSYPLSVKKISMDHQGGTKSYHLVCITTAEGNSIVINRYGKKGSIGQMVVDIYDTAAKAFNAYDKKYREKSGRGYRQVDQKDITVDNLDELKIALTLPVFVKVGAPAIAHLTGEAPAGMRDADGPEYDENGMWIGRNTRKADLNGLMEQQRAEEQAQSAAALSSNPNYGRF